MRLVNALLRVAQVVIALSLTPTPSPILPFVVRDIVTVYWVKLDDLRATQNYRKVRKLAGHLSRTNKCWDMVAAIYRDHSYHSHHTASLNNSEVVCGFPHLIIASDSLRNSRAGSRTIYQHGADVNVLFERRVSVVNTQSQHRSREKRWIDTTPCAGANGWPHRCSALEKRKTLIGR